MVIFFRPKFQPICVCFVFARVFDVIRLEYFRSLPNPISADSSLVIPSVLGAATAAVNREMAYHPYSVSTRAGSEVAASLSSSIRGAIELFDI